MGSQCSRPELGNCKEQCLSHLGFLNDEIDFERQGNELDAITRWIHALRIQGVFIEDIIEESRDGLLIAKIVDLLFGG